MKKPGVLIVGDLVDDLDLSEDSFGVEFARPIKSESKNGCWFLADNIGAINSNSFSIGIPRKCGNQKTISTAYSLYSQFPVSNNTENVNIKVWRIKTFLGVEKAIIDPKRPYFDEIIWYNEFNNKVFRKKQDNEPEEIDYLIIDDNDVSFRNLHNFEFIEKYINSNTVIILKCSADIKNTDLYKFIVHIKKKLKCEIHLIFKDNVLRSSDSKMRSYASWDQIIIDMSRTINQKNYWIKPETFDHVTIHFDRTGIFHLCKVEPGLKHSNFKYFSGVICPNEMPGDFEAQHPGKIYGSTSILTSIILQCRHNDSFKNEEKLSKYMIFALAAMRQQQIMGRGESNYQQQSNNYFLKSFSQLNTEFLKNIEDTEGLVKQLEQNTTFTPLTAMNLSGITLESENYLAHELILAYGITPEIVAQNGPNKLKQIPRVKIGSYISIDQKEIELINSTKRLISNYKHNTENKIPLSIAVFGPPGSGKSFSVKQIAKELFGESHTTLEFNLSQMSGPSEIRPALQRVRDESIRERIPLVFWDEFDCRGFEFISHFLMPMQDGKFIEDGVNTPLSKAVFVFAGGVCQSFKQFYDSRQDEEHKNKKITDFCSRINGYLDVSSMNFNNGESGQQSGKFKKINRALILNHLLRKHFKSIVKNDVLNINSQVLKAFLEVDGFEHGARSLEKIIISSSDGNDCFDRTCIQYDQQIHFHSPKFLNKLDEIN